MMETVRVERGTRASRIFAVLGVPALAALAAAVVGRCRRHAAGRRDGLLPGAGAAVEFARRLCRVSSRSASRPMSGFGAYAFFYLTGALNVNVYVALLLAGPFAGLMSIPVSFAVFRLRGAYFAVGTWVVSEVFALSASLIARARRRLRACRSRRDRAADFARPGHPRCHPLSDVAWALRSLVFAVVYLLLRSRHGLALTAIRNSEPASASLGVNTFRTKFIIYIVTAACTGLVGGLIFLQKLRVSPEAGFQHQRLDRRGDLHGGDRRHRHPRGAVHRHADLHRAARIAGRLRHDLSDPDGRDRDRDDAEGAVRASGAGWSSATTCICFRSAGAWRLRQQMRRPARHKPHRVCRRVDQTDDALYAAKPNGYAVSRRRRSDSSDDSSPPLRHAPKI